MSKKDVKGNLQEHSEAKVELLSVYIEIYLSIICNDGVTSMVNVYDLFCGEGVYKDGKEGSPIVIMRAIKNVYYRLIAKSTKTIKINSFFNDLKKEKVANTKKMIAEKSLYYPEIGKISFSSLDYKEYLDSLESPFPKGRNEKAFVFIDPYEYKHIKVADIQKLMRSTKTEVLLWLPTQFMYRFEKNGTPTALKDFIEEIVPFENWKQSTSVWTFVSQLKEGFQKVMGEQFYVDNFTIQKDISTVYCLFFFTSHIKGFEKMLEAKWKIDTDKGQGWSYSGNQISLFKEARNNPLETKLTEYLQEKLRTNGELYEFTLRSGFLPKHTREILISWQKANRITVHELNDKQARRGAFYLSYQYYKNDSSKVTISMD